ncbi:MAG: D-alanyl-D-alanine carboxypeptidase family protein [Cyanobacteria bacterium J06554_11]
MSPSPSKDIPPARREPTEVSLAEIENIKLQSEPRRHRLGLVVTALLVVGMGGIGAWQWDKISPHLRGMKAAIAASGFLSKETLSTPAAPKTDSDAAKVSQPNNQNTAQQNTAQQSTAQQKNPTIPATSNTASSDTLNSSATPADAEGQGEGEQAAREGTEREPDVLLNHRRYEVASEEDLVQLNPNSQIKLQPDVQAAIAQMIVKAKAEGVRLGIISGFRTLEDQNYLYFDVKAERGQSAQTRAEVSAPPGYSEHHTGYAVDFIDEGRSETHLQESFETTAAFKWLQENAPYYNFELSFPKDNASGVAYEPWHWRYVGNQESLELFYK